MGILNYVTKNRARYLLREGQFVVGRIAFVVVEEIVKFWECWKSSGLMRNIVVFGFLCFGVLPSSLAVFCLVACLDWKLPVPFQQTLLRILPFVDKYTGIMLCYNTDQCILLSIYTDQLLLQCSVSLLGDVWNRCCCYVASCYQRELLELLCSHIFEQLGLIMLLLYSVLSLCEWCVWVTFLRNNIHYCGKFWLFKTNFITWTAFPFFKTNCAVYL